MIVTLLACAGDEPGDGPNEPRRPSYPLDDVLTFADLQAKGTHNSYHVETTPVGAWEYTHEPLGVQLEEQGVRQFELDVSWEEELGRHRVYHVPLLDEGTTCETFTDCAADLFAWSEGNPGHHPLFVLVETKDPFPDEGGPERLASLDAELLEAWPRERLIAPDDVDMAVGWPTLGELRDKALFVVHDGGSWRETYVADLAGRPMFPDAQGDPDLPYAAVHTMNDPYDPRIAEVVGRGHLVRTRCDGDTEQARANDTAQRDRALASGAHFVSTDFPVPVDTFGNDYAVEIPGGTPSRCNPLTAPPECTSAAIEDLDGSGSPE